MLLDIITTTLFYTRNVLVPSSNNITYYCYADDTQPNLSFPSGSTQCEAFICGCHVDISEWMPAHHLMLSPDKSELLLFQGCFCPLQIFPSSLTTLQWPLLPVNKFTAIPDNQLSFIKHLPSRLRLTPLHFYSASSEPRWGLSSPPRSLSRIMPPGLSFISQATPVATKVRQYISARSSRGIRDRKKRTLV